MKDGHLNKCKVCVRNRVCKHRAVNIDALRGYDLERARKGRVIELRRKFPNKYKARGAVVTALSSGKYHAPLLVHLVVRYANLKHITGLMKKNIG